MKSVISTNLAGIRERIAQACRDAGRDPASVTLVAVTKGVDAARIAAAVAAGQRHFGESYVQEAADKIALPGGMMNDSAMPGSSMPGGVMPGGGMSDGAMSSGAVPGGGMPGGAMSSGAPGESARPAGAPVAPPPRAGLTWHFIGPVQGNKTRDIAQAFDWVHGVDRLRIAHRLSDQRPANLPVLNVCVQVNISGEATKAGVAPADCAALCRAVAALPRLRLRGLMAIPAPVAAGGDAREPYRRLKRLLDDLRAGGLALDTLSAGMSGDFEAAIAEGSTIVRIGTAIFGERA